MIHKTDGVVQRRTGDSGINRRRRQLRKRPGQSRCVVRFPARHQIERLNRQIVDQHRAARGCALSQTCPVVNHRQPRCAARHKRQLRSPLFVQRQHAQPVRIQRTGAITFTSVDTQPFCRAGQSGLDILHRLAAGFRQRVGKAVAAERQFKEKASLFITALQANIFQQAVMVLRDLSQRRIRRGDNRNDRRQRGSRHLRAAIFTQNGDAPQPTVGKGVHYLWRHNAAEVAFRGAGLQIRGNFMGNTDGFLIAGDAISMRGVLNIIWGILGYWHSIISSILSARANTIIRLIFVHILFWNELSCLYAVKLYLLIASFVPASMVIYFNELESVGAICGVKCNWLAPRLSHLQQP